MSRPSRNLANATILPKLPDYFDRARGESIPPDLLGATIIEFGSAPKESDLEGGGLIIDYIPRDQTKKRRLVLAFNELGMWSVKTD